MQAMDKLTVSGRYIVDRAGAPVRLRGVNIGGWMNMESFINGYPGTESGLRAAFSTCLGPERAQFFFERWLDHFFTEADVRFLRELGANVIRLPLNYRHFEADREPFHYLEPGFARLERALDWCAQHGLYAILDLHAAPGWQNGDWHSDNPHGAALLWSQPHFQARCTALWAEIARRFGGRPEVAGYDLLNEPLSAPDSEKLWGEMRPDWQALNGLYRRAAEAVRQVDPQTILFLEGDGWGNRFEGLELPEVDNVALSSHNYNRAGWGPGAYPGLHREGYWDEAYLLELTRRHEGTRLAEKEGLPLLAGEFGPVFNGAPEDRPSRLRGLRDQIQCFEALEMHWTAWTYKDVGVMGWLNLDPESPYMQLSGPFEPLRRRFHTDPWMYWLPSTAPKEKLGEIAAELCAELPQAGLDEKRLQGALVRAALGGAVSEALLVPFARAFQGCSEPELDEILESFSLARCRPNPGVLETLRFYIDSNNFNAG